MHEAVDLLERSLATTNPTEAYAVAHGALASATKVIARADDSSGVIGDACRRLLELHPRLAADAQPQPFRLVDWMIKFQFEGDVDYFEIDPVAYAPALGSTGMYTYRKNASTRNGQNSIHPPQVLMIGRSPIVMSDLFWIGTTDGWPCSTETSTQSFGPTPETNE
jgi:hypothetical protein